MKYALLVGINRYKKPGNDLSGCLNDIYDLRDSLLTRGWDQKDILVLTDSYATRDGIVDGLHWLFCQDSDEPCELLFHYSGHGSQVRCRTGDEGDRLDEILCPHDCDDYWDDPLSDDVLRSIFKLKPKMANLTVILDCCYSGTGTRAIKKVGTQTASRYLRAPEVMGNVVADLPVNRLGVKQERGLGQTCSQMNHVLLAGSQHDQTSADACFGGRYNGAWTWALLRALRVMDIHSKTHDVFARAAMMVREEGFSQRPACEGRKDLKERMFLGGGH